MSHQITGLDCFEGLVSLKGTCDDTPSLNSVYINELGIDTTFIEQILTGDYADVTDFWERKRIWAVQNVVNQIHNHVRPKYKTTTVIDRMKVGFYGDNLDYVAGNGKLVGINISLCNTNSFLDFFLNQISLQVSATQTITVLVYDLMQNRLLDTIEVDAVADEITTVYANKTYRANLNKMDLLIVYDSTGVSANKTTLSECLNCSGRTYSKLNNSYEKITATQITSTDGKITANLEAATYTGGLSIVHSLHCNHESWLCAISNSLAMPLLYKTAAVIYDHALTGANDNRTNTPTTSNREYYKERLEKMEYLYAQSMDSLLQNIKPPANDICFECRDNVRHKVVLP